MSKIDIFLDRYEYHIAWVDEDDEGAWIGQDAATPTYALTGKLAEAKKKRDFEEYEYLAVELASREWVGKAGEGVSRANDGYAFESMAKTKKFLIAMRAAMKVARSEFETGIPWPDWAKQAKAAGWKPPKGWKP